MKKNMRVILMLVAVCCVYLFSAYVLTPASESSLDTLFEKHRKLRQYEAAVKASRNMDAELKTLGAELQETEKRLVTAKSAFLGSAKIQNEITALFNKAGLTMSTVRPLSSVKLGDYTEIPIYFEGSGNIKQLSNFFKSVEEDQMLLKTDKLSINITNMQKTYELKFKIQISGLGRI